VPRLPIGLKDASTYPRITQELLNRGYDKEQIHKILGGNALRILRGAERVAKELQADSE
jgi:membrane dipeptidase